MDNNIETVENVKVEETVTENVATEQKAEVRMIAFEEAEKMVKGALAKNLPSKEEMAEFKKYKESLKTEADKQAEKDKELETLRQEKQNTQRENVLLKKGVNSDDLDYVMFKVGKMEGEFEENLVEFLKENTKFTAKEEKSVASTTGVKTNGTETKESGVTAILRAKRPDLFND